MSNKVVLELESVVCQGLYLLREDCQLAMVVKISLLGMGN